MLMLDSDHLCLICRDNSELPDFITRCGHYFHHDCITEWFNQMQIRVCPLCRCHITINKKLENLYAQIFAGHCFDSIPNLKFSLTEILYFIVSRGIRVDLLPLFLESGQVDINDELKNEGTPLAIATKNDQSLVAEILLNYGADPSIMDPHKLYPAHYICKHGNVSLMKRLIKKNAKLEVYDSAGWTSFHYACAYGHLDIVQLFCRLDAYHININNHGPLSIHLACKFGHKSIVSYLLNQGTFANYPNEIGYTPMHTACKAGHLDIVKLLFYFGADCKIKDDKGFVPLQCAIKYGHQNIIQFLLEHIEVNLDENENTKLLQSLCKFGDLKLVKLFYCQCEKFVKVEGPFLMACKAGNFEIFDFFLKLGVVDVNGCSEMSGMAPVHYACKAENLDIMRALYQNGADLNVKDLSLRSPIHFTCQKNLINLIMFLVNRRADIMAKDISGSTPLHIACKYGNYEAVKFLIEQGADAGAVNKYGCTPFHFACQGGNLKIVQFLTRHGSDVGKMNNLGTAPIFYAAEKRHDDIIKFLDSNATSFLGENYFGLKLTDYVKIQF